MSVTINLKALPAVPAELSLHACVTMLYAFNDHAKELAKLFPPAVDDMSPDFDRLASVVDVGKDLTYVMKDAKIASYGDFSLGMSVALELKDAFAAFAATVQNMAARRDKSFRFQQALDFYVTDFRRELDRRVCRLWAYHPETVGPLGDALRGWRVPR